MMDDMAEFANSQAFKDWLEKEQAAHPPPPEKEQ